jgi:hypothetical protein
MGFLDKIKGQARSAVDRHGDSIATGVDKAADAIDKKTGGKHPDHIVKGRTQAKDALDKLDGKNDDIR